MTLLPSLGSVAVGVVVVAGGEGGRGQVALEGTGVDGDAMLAVV